MSESSEYGCPACHRPVRLFSSCRNPKCKAEIDWSAEKEKWTKIDEKERKAFEACMNKKVKAVAKDNEDLFRRLSVLSEELKYWIETGRFPVESTTQIGVLDAMGMSRQTVVDPTTMLLGKGNILMLSELQCDVPPNAIIIVEDLEFAVTYSLKNYEQALKMLLESMASVNRKSREEVKQILMAPSRVTMGDTLIDQLSERLAGGKR